MPVEKQFFCRIYINVYRLILSIAIALLASCSKQKNVDFAAERMQEFVSNISQYARTYDADFIIIPQNGIELAYNKANPEEGQNSLYLAAVDGFGVEELFYSGTYSPDNYRLSLLRQLKNNKKILISEFVSNNDNIQDAYQRNYNEGFVCFVRQNNNYHYWQIPNTIINENTTDVINLLQVENFLYLINTDNFATKQEYLNAISATNFDLVLIDLFFNGVELTKTDVNQLKNKANGGRRLVLAYINIGAAEKFRYYWQNDWKLNNPRWIKKRYKGYNDEFYVEFWDKQWQEIIYGNENSYIKRILNAGFDGAYLDNVEAYYFLYHND